MKYQVTNEVVKQGQKGEYVQCTLTNENGEVFENINLFNGETKDSKEIEGDLVQNGKYWNFRAKVVHTANFPTGGAKAGMIGKAMETKAANIEHAQDRKEIAIANAGSITNATNLVVAMINAGIIPSIAGEAQIQDAVTKYAKWYRTMYDNPSNNDNAPF
jgi:hypothetical protein